MLSQNERKGWKIESPKNDRKPNFTLYKIIERLTLTQNKKCWFAFMRKMVGVKILHFQKLKFTDL